ncbi:MAG: DJ-1/PfpI family protein [Coriobacteriia bacterium]|nr:DJ-1/PfpI family protein [Coriobacteriia bacterium]MBN2823325.1 DJ-1/PfpI family protein [Coriobacteriia bacterium]
MKTVLMIIAPEQFRDEEYAHPREVLETRGASVVTGSVAPGPCIGKLGMVARAEVALVEADFAAYDAVVFVGGAGSKIYFDDHYAHKLARAMHDNGKVVAAICIAPSVLAHAGLLGGVHATAFASQEDDLREHGAIWTGAPVEVDGLIITGNGPEAARDFGATVADALDLP